MYLRNGKNGRFSKVLHYKTNTQKVNNLIFQVLIVLLSYINHWSFKFMLYENIVNDVIINSTTIKKIKLGLIMQELLG
jgi:hypothetical protein